MPVLASSLVPSGPRVIRNGGIVAWRRREDPLVVSPERRASSCTRPSRGAGNVYLPRLPPASNAGLREASVYDDVRLCERAWDARCMIGKHQVGSGRGLAASGQSRDDCACTVYYLCELLE